jgi:cell division protein FtsQ
MDGRGRLAQSLKWLRKPRASPSAAAAASPRARRLRKRVHLRHARTVFGRVVERRLAPLLALRLPRGLGVALAALIMLGTGVCGVVYGGHGSMFVDELANLRDAGANAIGFRITSITLAGNRQVTREEILATAGVTGNSSLLFLDVDRTRDRLKTNSWIADATVLKLYPGELKITVSERKPFALWQKDHRLSVIAADGTVLEPYAAHRFAVLPLVVGAGAATRARAFLALIGEFPDIRRRLRAAVLVAERRWNLRLDNGVDVRLPEAGVERALATLVALDRDKKLLSRDILAVDLRLPDRVTVRLSDAAAAARAQAFKDKIKPRKGGHA